MFHTWVHNLLGAQSQNLSTAVSVVDLLETGAKLHRLNACHCILPQHKVFLSLFFALVPAGLTLSVAMFFVLSSFRLYKYDVIYTSMTSYRQRYFFQVSFPDIWQNKPKRAIQLENIVQTVLYTTQ